MGSLVNSVNNVFVELSVVLGKTTLPIQLGTKQDDEIWILANNVPIARGEIVVQGERVAVSITSVLTASESSAQHS